MASDIKSFEISNYKSIKESGEIRIPGISLILGPNGSGKTNILESLLLLKQTFENNQANLKLNGNIIKTGEFANIIYRKISMRAYHIDLILNGRWMIKIRNLSVLYVRKNTLMKATLQTIWRMSI